MEMQGRKSSFPAVLPQDIKSATQSYMHNAYFSFMLLILKPIYINENIRGIDFYFFLIRLLFSG